MRGSARSYVLVGVQFAALIGIALSGPLIPPSPAGALLALLGVLLGVWAALSMRLPEISVLPEVRPGARLVTRGPYRLIRHPMYSALLLLGLGLVLGAPSPWRWLLWLALLVNLVIKLSYEERLLAARFPEYPAYRRGTWRLIPFLFYGCRLLMRPIASWMPQKAGRGDQSALTMLNEPCSCSGSRPASRCSTVKFRFQRNMLETQG
jgi:protein-S-isoprenylcysteine O-methyltransferase Ste14